MLPRLPLHNVTDHGRADAISRCNGTVRHSPKSEGCTNLPDIIRSQPGVWMPFAYGAASLDGRVRGIPSLACYRLTLLASSGVAIHDGRIGRQGMALPADVGAASHHRWVHPASKVLASRHRLKVRWVHARRDAAQMVNHKAVRDRAVCIFPCETVRRQSPAVEAGFPVAVLITCPRPYPARPKLRGKVRGWPVLVNFGPRSCGQRSGATDAPHSLVADRMVVDAIGANVARLDIDRGATMGTHTLNGHRALQSLVARPWRCATTVRASSRQLYHRDGHVVSFTPGGR